MERRVPSSFSYWRIFARFVRAVRGLGLRELVDEEGHLLAGGVQLAVDAFVVGIQGFEVGLQVEELLGQFGFFAFELVHEAALLAPDPGQGAAERQGGDGEDDGRGLQGSVAVFLLTLFAFDSLEGIFSHGAFRFKYLQIYLYL